MELISVKYAPSTEQEAKELIAWSVEGLANNNYFDPNVLFYPATIKLCAGSDSKRVVYVPVQHVLMLESLAINPEASKTEVAVGLRVAVNACQLLAQQAGIGEIYFLGTNDQTNAFAQKHGFTEVPWKAYKMPAKFGVQHEKDSYQDSNRPADEPNAA